MNDGAHVAALIARLGLAPHPGGGWYRETWRAESVAGARSAGTSILFLLEAGQGSHWHRVDAAELWIFQAGTPLALSVVAAGTVERVRLGIDVLAGEQPQHLVPPHHWQAAEAGAGWCLVACVVVPAFRFEGFELAPPGWSPEDGEPSGLRPRPA
jgi:predicted cupin superfamily sugar epimerase